MSTSSLKTLLLSSAVGLFALGVVLSQSDILQIPTNFGTHTPKLAEIYLGTTTGGQVVRLGANKEVVIPEGLVAGQAFGTSGNIIESRILNATIGGGIKNTIWGLAYNSTIGAGKSNLVVASNASIGAGLLNQISSASAENSFIAGWEENEISNKNSVIWGGKLNKIYAQYGVIPGGSDNKINSTANYSFVAGQRGVANNVGTFIWSDYDDLEHNLIQGQKEFQSTTNNTFLIRALNGMAINTNTVNPGVNVAVNGTISLGSEGKLAQSCSGANGALLSGTLESRNGCMYYCDGKYRQLLNRKNDEIVQRCGENAPGTYKPNIAYKFCMLKENIDGSIYSIEYEPGETVVAYPQRVANSCTSQVITCNQNGQWTAHPTGGEWSIKCLAGSGASTPITYGCIGHVPNNADVCAGDEGGTFTTDVLRTIATTGCTTAKKCEYTCKANYHKDPTSQNCLPDIQTFTCGVKPAGSVWNMGVNNGSYPQTRNGSAWIPANTSPTYNTTASASECRYKCPVNYTRNGTSCTIPTRTFTCTAKPASNTQWNTVSSYTQTQINGVWTPADSTTQYNSEASATSCRYTCASGYIRNGSSCQKSSCDARSYSVGSRTYTLPSIGHGEAITRNPNTNPVDNTPTNGKTSYSAIFTCSYGTWTYEEDAVVTCNSGYSRNAAGACVQKCLPANKTVNGRDYALGETDVGDTHSAMSTNSPLIGLPANGTSRYNMTFMCSNGSRSNGPVELPNSLDCSHYDQNNNYDDSRTYDVYNSQGGVYSNGQEAVSFCCNKGYEVSGTTCQPKSCPGQARTVNGHTYTVITIAHSQTYTTSPTGTPWVWIPTNGSTSYWTTFTCNLGNRSNGTEQSSVSCNVGYTKNGNTCQVNSYTLTVNPGGSTYSQNYNTTKSVTAPAGTSYTVSYNVNGGTSTVPSSSTSTKPFSSWSLTSGTWSLSTTTSATTTFTYKAGNGTITATYGAQPTVTLPAAPTRANYTFNGRYTATSGGTKRGNAGATYTPTASETLYAQWTANATEWPTNVCVWPSYYCTSQTTQNDCLYNNSEDEYDHPKNCTWIPSQSTYYIEAWATRSCNVWFSNFSDTMWSMSYPYRKTGTQTYSNGTWSACKLEAWSMCSYTAGACPSGYSCKSWEFGAGSSQNDCYNKLKNSANMVAQWSNLYYKHPNGYKIWLSYYNNRCISIYYHCVPN